MPLERMIPDMVLVPDGSELIFNGANKGAAGVQGT